MKRITVSATQLGGLCGYQKPMYAAFESVWKRSFPVSYYDAIARNNIVLDEETFRPPPIIQKPETSHDCRKLFSSACKIIQASDARDKSSMKKAMKKYIYTSFGDAAETSLFQHVHRTMFPLRRECRRLYLCSL